MPDRDDPGDMDENNGAVDNAPVFLVDAWLDSNIQLNLSLLTRVGDTWSSLSVSESKSFML
jgi:hypothetical protein